MATSIASTPARWLVEPDRRATSAGSSRLEEPLSRYPVDAVFHGHAHHGQPEGRTLSGVQVYNVSHSLLQRLYPDHPPVRILTLAKPAIAEP